MNSIGFGKASLKGTWKTDWLFADDIEANAVVLRPERGDPVALVTSDMLTQWPRRSLALRDAVARRLHTVPDKVGILCTQNHAVPVDAPEIFDLERLEAAFAQAAASALNAAVPAVMTYVETSPNPPGVVNRRVRFDDAGSFTFYFGFELRPDGRAGYAHLLDLAIRGLYAGPEQTLRNPCPEAESWPVVNGIPPLPPYPVFNDAEDPLIQGLFFKTPDGQPIGSISRWAAHPITANVAGVKRHTADYPYYVRQCLARKFGGGAVFLTGPCGNQAPCVDRKSLALAQRTGDWVGRQLLDALSSATWKPLD
ncbi:MAG: hypothetical protein Q8O57_10755, partial [Kiritimatiellota bacterium]|nr:hypothetical protein [Kiritimatiellota bacterium]